ncbi:PAS domain-containing sensor histidine kinase, partial [Acidobacteriota bacterium]
TLLSKFNKYSRMEILSPEGVVFSEFSLNVPEIFRPHLEFPISQSWTLMDRDLLYLGEEKDFLIAYKDWYASKDHLGRIIVFLMVDYESLPFLYSANPYFEVMRSTSLPSLNQLDLGFAIYDLDGSLIFNPNHISSGLSNEFISLVNSTEGSIWANFQDKGNRYNGLYFVWTNRIFSLFLPQPSLVSSVLGYLRLFLFYGFMFLIFILLFAILYSPNSLQNPFWSFSNRVHISFITITLIPLVLFTFSTRSFFGRIISEQLTDKAEMHAGITKRVMEDFEIFQREDQVSLTLPSDDIVLWISSTIVNDVNLYQSGKLVSSSRREFFDYGIFPELINGEIFYNIRYENSPYTTQTQKIGDYSFHTLTIPYSFQDSQILISLPYPLERQELSKATEALIEFLFLISVFLIIGVIPIARGIGGMIVKPIRKLLSGTREVSLGNLEIQLDYKNKDEMKTLIEGFNSMINNLKKHQQDLTEMGKKVAWAEMARKVAHEIKNPLTPIQLSAEHLLTVYREDSDKFEEALKESTSYIITEVQNLRNIAHEFMKISKEVVTKKETFNLGTLIEETIGPYKKILSHRIEFNETYNEEEAHISADKEKITVALKNIFTNAIEAIQEKGKITVRFSRGDRFFLIEISDTGTGINKDDLANIFQSYFSTKDVGTGLGLPIAKKIIEDHDGRIEVSSRPGKGTLIKIFLPIDQAEN